jgi:hypothetical protein
VGKQIVDLFLGAAKLDVGFFLSALQHFVAAVQDVFGLFDLVRQRGAHLVNEVEEPATIEHDAGADGHAPPFRDHLFQSIDEV